MYDGSLDQLKALYPNEKGFHHIILKVSQIDQKGEANEATDSHSV